MSKLNSAFGDSKSLRIKTFTLGEHGFKVRVPLSKELEDIQTRVSAVDKDKAEARYIKMAAPFLADTSISGVEIKEDDVVVDGRSLRDLVNTVSMMESKIVEYVKLLVPIEGTLDDITYEEIEAEWPTQVQMELLEKISEAIQPGYKDARKN
jgi:hypothetical protein